MHDGKRNMPGYLNSSANKAVDKRATEFLTNKTHNDFTDVFKG